MSTVIKHSASARVTLTVEIDVGSSWGADCTVEQVYKQAGEEAVNQLRRMVERDKDRSYHNVRLIGAPQVTAILAKRSET